MAQTTTPLPKPAPAAIFRAMAEGGVLFSSESEVYFGVNPVGAIIWELLPQCDTVEQLVSTLAQRFSDVGVDRIQRDVSSFLTDLRANGLVIDAPSDGAGGSAAPNRAP
ncbi:MAG: PqqD family protein [Gemmatimonadaceae bacterium]